MDDVSAEIDEIEGLSEAVTQAQSKPAPWSQEKTTKRSSKSSNDQQNLFEKLKEYETKRRSVYSSKWDSMSLYWKSYKDLLSASLQETGRAERLVLGTCRAHQQYSNARQARHDDIFLDEKGNVANEKQQKRLAAARKNQGPKSKAQSITVVKDIQQSHHTLANRFGENAKNMDHEIAETIQSLHEDLKKQFSDMERLGTSIIEELEKTEQEVTKAWGKSFSEDYRFMCTCRLRYPFSL
jgi:CRISPR/Cas system CMR subunit Cmr6 (Cas7 group RAMP superfamily)